MESADAPRADVFVVSVTAEGVSIDCRWFVPASREAVDAIASDFERLDRHFPRVAQAVRLVAREGHRLDFEVEAGSFGRFFPRVRVTLQVELRPGTGYRCSTVNHTLKTTGEEELLLRDVTGGTQVAYSYRVRVRRPWLRAPYAWLVRRWGLPYWKRAYLQPLTRHALDHERRIREAGAQR